MKERSVLFIHHGTILGGAPVSLSLQVRGIINNGEFSGTIASHSKPMRLFFSNSGIPVIPWIYPCTYLGKVLIGLSELNGMRAFHNIIRDIIYFPLIIFLQTLMLMNRKEKIIHLNSSVLFSSAIAARISQKKIVWHIREAGTIHPVIASIIYNIADRIICISPVEASRFRDPQKKVQVIYNPVDFEKFHYQPDTGKKIRRELGIPEYSDVIINMGGVNPRKGTAEIIQALKKCNREIYVLIIGPTPQYTGNNSYHQKVRNLCTDEMNPRVKFIGIVEDPAPYLSASDALVFIGMTPHFPRPVYEAWAMKKPVIVNEMEGISNNVDPDVNGIIIKEPLVDQLAECLEKDLVNKDHLKKMGESGYIKAVKTMSEEKSARMMENVFKSLYCQGQESHI